MDRQVFVLWLLTLSTDINLETGGLSFSSKLTKDNGTLTVSDGMYPFFGVQPVLFKSLNFIFT